MTVNLFTIHFFCNDNLKLFIMFYRANEKINPQVFVPHQPEYNDLSIVV